MVVCWDDLIIIMVNGIGVENDIVDFEFDVAYVFFGEDIFFGGLLECCNVWIFDFVEVLDIFIYIDDEVWVGGVWIEVLNFFGVEIFVLVVFVS